MQLKEAGARRVEAVGRWLVYLGVPGAFVAVVAVIVWAAWCVTIG